MNNAYLPTVLVVGGAGYIGSLMVKQLCAAGYQVTTLDNLSAGRREAVLGGEFVLGDCGDIGLLDRLFGNRRIDAVMHFASHILVDESISQPGKYYRNNFANTLTLLDAMARHEVRHFIFSSSAAIFGEPQYVPIDERHPKAPINAYGRSKLMVEQALADYERAYGLRSACLRYFNAAGADPEGQLGECHDPETHLIPMVLRVVLGRREALTVFGQDYDTPDGTCIRDYIHVVDLCSAHLLALDRLWRGAFSAAYNLGNGEGFTVNQVIAAAEQVTGRKVPVHYGPRRPGDPARLVADSGRAMSELRWTPRYPGLEDIIAHAWTWENRALP